jgi:hypothetical protein
MFERFAVPYNPMTPPMSSIHNPSPWYMNTPGSHYLHNMPNNPNISQRTIPNNDIFNPQQEHSNNQFTGYFPGLFNIFDPNTPQFPRANIAFSPINYTNFNDGVNNNLK